MYLPAFQKCGIRNAECEMKLSRTPACLIPRFAFHTPRSKWLPDLDSHQDKRFNRPPCYFDTTWQFEIGAAAKIPTCIIPLRRRMPHVFDHGSVPKWSEQQDFHLRPPGPKPGALKTELRSDKMADPKGFAPSAFPQTTGCSAN